MSRIIHTPDNGSTACVIVSGPLGVLYVQAVDAYGYQRELAVKQNPVEFELHCYQHPGRREVVKLTRQQTEKLVSRMEEICERYPHFLFNCPSERASRCDGFVKLQEAILRGQPIDDVLTDYL